VIALGTKSTSFFSLVVIADAAVATPKDREIQTVDLQNYSMNKEDIVISSTQLPSKSVVTNPSTIVSDIETNCCCDLITKVV
jgi:hypothetical protein